MVDNGHLPYIWETPHMVSETLDLGNFIKTGISRHFRGQWNFSKRGCEISGDISRNSMVKFHSEILFRTVSVMVSGHGRTKSTESSTKTDIVGHVCCGHDPT